MTTRRRAREIVLQLLYEEDLHPEQDVRNADNFLVKRLHGNRPLVEFAREQLHRCAAKFEALQTQYRKESRQIADALNKKWIELQEARHGRG